MDGRELSATLERLCLSAAAAATSGPSRAALEEVAASLRTPLRVAVAGRRGAGKSTLVNVLVGAALAPTDLRECTRLVTSFGQGAVDCVHVVGRDGSRTRTGLDGRGQVPAELPIPLGDVDHLEVTVTSSALDGLTVIDTPGLATVDDDRARRTEAFLRLPEVEARAGVSSEAAVAAAEAVLYVVGRTARADDRAVLEGLHSAAGRVGATSLNTVVVLNQIDRFGRRGDPWVAAGEAVEHYRERLGRAVVTVVPLVGVLAESLVTGRADHQLLRELRVLAAAPTVDDDALDTADELLAAAVDVPVHRRRRLIAALTLYGVREGVQALRADPQLPDSSLHRLLLDRSGHPVLRQVVDRVLRGQSDALKASCAVARVEAAARSAPRPDKELLHTVVEDFLAEPAAHGLRLLEVAQACDGGDLDLPGAQAEDLQLLVAGRTAAARLGCPESAGSDHLREMALAAMHRWAEFAAGADPDQARAAAVVRRAYQLLFRELTTVHVGEGRTG